MMYWVIRILMYYEERDVLCGFVVQFNNTHALPDLTLDAEKDAKRFENVGEALDWGKAYLPGYRWDVQRCQQRDDTAPIIPPSQEERFKGSAIDDWKPF
jgi:hypothetical protein